MDRVNYLFYQLFLKIKYEKENILYVLSFYVGLLLPTCCITNTRLNVIYYTTFKGMEYSFQVDWLNKNL